MEKVQKGVTVSLEYMIYLKEGTVIETNLHNEPMVFQFGDNQVIPGLEKNLCGMKVGEEKVFELEPNDAFGEFDPQAFQEVPKERIPQNLLYEGAVVKTSSPDGHPIDMWVNEVKDGTVVLNLNHPLAGKSLLCQIRVIDIRDPSSERILH